MHSARTPEVEGIDTLAAQLRGFGPLGIVALIAILFGNALVPPLSAILVLLWTRLSGTPWRAIGYVRPRGWLATFAIGIAFGIAFKFAMKALVMPLLGADPVNHAYHYLAGNTAALPFAIYTMIVVAGIGEETVFRGYLFERLGRLMGHGRAARVATVLISTAWFAFGHYSNQGVAGVEQAAVTGLVMGAIYARTGSLAMLMVAHAAFDLTAVAMIYWDVEARVAHLVFR